MTYPLIVAACLAACAALALALEGPRAAAGRLRTAVRAPGLGWWAVAFAVLVVAALPFLAGRYVDATEWVFTLALSTISFLALLLVLWRTGVSPDAVVRLLRAVPVPVVALLFAAAAVAAGLLVLEAIPHVSDEVAYQFQARTLAAGRLSWPAPPDLEAFAFTHTMVEDGRWFGIMNPGWPLLLAPGYLLGVPWLVGPLLGGASLLLFHGFLRDAGYGALESRLAVLLLAVSPLVLFLSASYMAHVASLFTLLLFLRCAVPAAAGRGAGWWLGAGAALALGLLVRPVDAAVGAAAFGLLLLVAAVRERRFPAGLLALGVVASLGAWLTLAYNGALTGHPLDFPMTRYFELNLPGERFGIGFGADMGTRLHGPEWPGFYPADAVRVTAHRMVAFLGDVHALPLPLLAVLAFAAAAALRRGVASLRQRWRERRAGGGPGIGAGGTDAEPTAGGAAAGAAEGGTRAGVGVTGKAADRDAGSPGKAADRPSRGPTSVEWHLALVASAVLVVAVYFFHFYHGIAYGSRHYFLALPGVAVALARPMARWLRSPRRPVAALAAAGLGAALLHTLLYAYPPLLREYGDRYRGSSDWVREALEERDLSRAIVFVEAGNWSWKSAFPLNEYPLERNDALLARDLGPETRRRVSDAFPGRRLYRLSESRPGEGALESLP